MADQFKTDYYKRRFSSMKTERESFIGHWKKLADFMQPRRGRFFMGDQNKGDRRSQSIINSKATTALRIARSGIMAGLMSPSRPWFDLEPDDPELKEHHPSREWMYDTQQLCLRIFRSGNLYNMAPTMFQEALLFATGCMTHVDDFEDVARFYSHTAGSYMIDLDNRHEVSTLAREFSMTVGAMVQEFGLENVSRSVRDSYDKSNYGIWVPVNHIIEPNREYSRNSALSKYKPFKSCYFDPADENKNRLLSEMGYDEFPAYVLRWDVTNEDIYGTDCPGITALGDTIGLQHMEKRKAQGIDKQMNPPLKGPANLRKVPVSGLPGGMTAFEGDQSNPLQPIYQVTPQIGEMRQDITGVEQRIDDAFYVNLFRAFTNMEGIQPRNEYDLQNRNQERLLELGPVIERFQGEFQSKLIIRTINQATRAGILRPAPLELQGRPMKINYIGPLAIAQRAVAAQPVERVFTFVGGLIKAGWADAGDKVIAEQAIDEYAQAFGAPPGIIRDDEDVAKLRAQRAQAQQEERAAEGAQMAANTAKMASDAKTSEPSVLTALAGAVGQRR